MFEEKNIFFPVIQVGSNFSLLLPEGFRFIIAYFEILSYNPDIRIKTKTNGRMQKRSLQNKGSQKDRKKEEKVVFRGIALEGASRWGAF